MGNFSLQKTIYVGSSTKDIEKAYGVPNMNSNMSNKSYDYGYTTYEMHFLIKDGKVNKIIIMTNV